MSKVQVMDHPLIQHKINYIRNEEVGSKEFREIVGEIASLMCYEATRDLKMEDVKIKTPICEMTGKQLSGKKLAVVPILRAGLGMVDGMLNMIPSAKVGHIGLYRDPQTYEPVEYYCKLPSDCDEREVFVVDPMLATGGSCIAALQMLEKAYCEKVEQVKHYIHEGDLFQLVLSNRLEADFEGSLLDTYRVLRTTNPSPYMFYFSSDDVEIAGASPETLVKVEDGEVRTFPLAGTRQRGKSYEEDQRLEKELLADEKERAEHNMLVDLGRNDLGKICDFGTVEVEKYMSIERYSHVMHIGSTVKGQLRKDKTAVDAIDSVLPAGTLSGAPKLRACQIINELENNKRGIYGGQAPALGS